KTAARATVAPRRTTVEADTSVHTAGVLPERLAFGALCLLLALSPYGLSGFWPSTYDYLPQALFLSVTACVCLLLAISGPSIRTPQSPFRTPVVGLLAAFFAWCAL